MTDIDASALLREATETAEALGLGRLESELPEIVAAHIAGIAVKQDYRSWIVAVAADRVGSHPRSGP